MWIYDILWLSLIMIVLPINLTNKNKKILTITLPRRSRPPNRFFPDFGSLPNHIQKFGFCPRDRASFGIQAGDSVTDTNCTPS